MIKRTLFFGNPAYLSTKNNQIVITYPDKEQESKTAANAGQYYVVITADQDRQKVLKLMKYNE